MRFFSSPVLWNGAIRTALFWSIVLGVIWGASLLIPVLNFQLIFETVEAAFSGDLGGLSTQAFAFALALEPIRKVMTHEQALGLVKRLSMRRIMASRTKATAVLA